MSKSNENKLIVASHLHVLRMVVEFLLKKLNFFHTFHTINDLFLS